MVTNYRNSSKHFQTSRRATRKSKRISNNNNCHSRRRFNTRSYQEETTFKPNLTLRSLEPMCIYAGYWSSVELSDTKRRERKSSWRIKPFRYWRKCTSESMKMLLTWSNWWCSLLTLWEQSKLSRSFMSCILKTWNCHRTKRCRTTWWVLWAKVTLWLPWTKLTIMSSCQLQPTSQEC